MPPINVRNRSLNMIVYSQLALQQALADCESDQLVEVALLNRSCCLFVCNVSALRDFHKRVAFVGVEEYARIPTHVFQFVCGVGFDGYEPWNFKRYLEYLQDPLKVKGT